MPIITVQKLNDADRDADSLDDFVSGNGKKEVTTRRGKKYKTAPEVEQTLLDNGLQRGFPNLAALQAHRPAVLGTLAKDMSTRKIWMWSGDTWVDTGKSDVDIILDIATVKSKEIPPNSDLNDYIKEGVYYCSGATAATLTNCPVSVAFALEVLPSTTVAYPIHRLTTPDLVLYRVRQHINEQYVFSNWKDFLDLPTIKSRAIKSGDDLFTYKTEGKFYSSGGNALTLKNCPTKGSFNLNVFYTNLGYSALRIIDSYNEEFICFSYLKDGVVMYGEWIQNRKNIAVLSSSSILSELKDGTYICTSDVATYIIDSPIHEDFTLVMKNGQQTISTKNNEILYRSSVESEFTYLLENKYVSKKPRSLLKTYIAKVKNKSNQDLINKPVLLKFEFEQCLVFSNEQITVEDESGNFFNAQFAPDFYANYRKNAMQGYHSDGSFWCGTLYIFDSLNVDEVKNYKIRVYDQNVSSKPEQHIVSSERISNTIFSKISVFGFDLLFNRNFAFQQLQQIRVNNQLIQIGVRPRFVSANAAETGTASTEMSEDSSIRIINSGLNFIDVETTVYSRASASIEALKLKATYIYRLFKNGELRIIFKHSAVDEIAKNKLYGMYCNINNVYDSSVYKDDFYLAQQFKVGAETISVLPAYVGYDVHREQAKNGPARPSYQFVNVLQAASNFQFGWLRTQFNNESIKDWVILKDWCWSGDIAYFLKSNESETAQRLSDYIHNNPTAFAVDKFKPSRVMTRELLRKVDQYLFDVADWYFSPDCLDVLPLVGNPPTNSRNYSHTFALLDVIKNNGDFENWYAKYHQFLLSNTMQPSIDKIGDAYYVKDVMFSSDLPQYFLPALHYGHLYALRIGKTEIAEALKSGLKSIADNLATYALQYNGVATNGYYAPSRGSHNLNVFGCRTWAIAISIGLDDPRYMQAFNMINDQFNDRSQFMPTLNIINDEREQKPAISRYFEYYLYGAHSYAITCSMLEIRPKHDLTQFILDATNSNGDVHEYAWTLSESRRGNKSIWVKAIAPMITSKDCGNIALAAKIFRQVESSTFNDEGYPAWICEFVYREGDKDNTRDFHKAQSEINWMITALSDILLSREFGVI